MMPTLLSLPTFCLRTFGADTMHDKSLGPQGAQDALVVHTNLVGINHSFHLTQCRGNCRVQSAVCRPSIILLCAVYAARPGKSRLLVCLAFNSLVG